MDDADDPVRVRLIRGFSAAIAQRGYGGTTIADIVRRARVSKRTFYEHFETKEDCFLASYEAAAGELLVEVASAVDPASPWERQVEAAVRAYLGALEREAPLSRAFMLEVNAAGPRALALRREVHGRFAEVLRGLVEAGRGASPRLRRLSPDMATAVVGGIHELVLVALERGRGLGKLAGTAADLVRAVIAPAPGAAS